MPYIIDCPNCGIVHNNKSDLICDYCGTYFKRIKLGNIWYDTDELEEDNPYN